MFQLKKSYRGASATGQVRVFRAFLFFIFHKINGGDGHRPGSCIRLVVWHTLLVLKPLVRAVVFARTWYTHTHTHTHTHAYIARTWCIYTHARTHARTQIHAYHLYLSAYVHVYLLYAWRCMYALYVHIFAGLCTQLLSRRTIYVCIYTYTQVAEGRIH